MKTIIPFLLLFVSFNLLQAQGNLQFNQVKLVGTIETVPIGKVWKIEAIVYNANLVGPPSGLSGNDNIIKDEGIIINGNLVSTRSVRSQGSYYYQKIINYYVWSIELPIWLPSGTSLSKGDGVLYISIMEFNNVP